MFFGEVDGFDASKVLREIWRIYQETELVGKDAAEGRVLYVVLSTSQFVWGKNRVATLKINITEN